MALSRASWIGMQNLGEIRWANATLSREADAPLGRMVGDLLVLRASAWGQGRGERLRFPVDHYPHVGGANHFDLLNHPAIYEQIQGWLARERELLSAASA